MAIEVGRNRVSVHWHFRKNAYSVSEYVDGKGWRVVRDSDGLQRLFKYVRLQEAEFVVSAAGKERARREGIRNVHASIRGNIMWCSEYPVPLYALKTPQYTMVMYSPFAYEEPYFRTYQQEPKFITYADEVYLGVTLDQRPEIRAVGWQTV